MDLSHFGMICASIHLASFLSKKQNVALYIFWLVYAMYFGFIVPMFE